MCYETRENIKYTDHEQQPEIERMRRVPDILPVCMQDILYSRKSDLRAEEISSSWESEQDTKMRGNAQRE